MSKIAGVVFFLAWLLCGCSIESITEDWRGCVVFVVALIVCIVSAALITSNDD